MTTTATATTAPDGHSSTPIIAIPIINISGYISGDPSETKYIIAAVRAAAISPGFFQVTGHLISSDLRRRLLGVLKAFFALPPATKTALHRDKSRCLRGYEGVGDQELEPGIRDRKEGFMIGQEIDGSQESLRFAQGLNQWPNETEAPGFRGVVMEYFEEMRSFSRLMFRIVARGLGLEERYFDDFVYGRDTVTMCRAHRYPPTSPDKAAKSRGIGAHTDFGALTLLLQDDIGGLEVFHRPTQTWHRVQPVQDAYVVNIGDMMEERWTNDKYTSTLHRVISPINEKDRYSVAYFNEGLLDQVIECIPTCLEPGSKPKYESVRVEDHLRNRYSGSY